MRKTFICILHSNQLIKPINKLWLKNYMKNDDGIDSCGNGNDGISFLFISFFFSTNSMPCWTSMFDFGTCQMSIFPRKVISFPKLNCGKFAHRHLVCLPKLYTPLTVFNVVNAMCAFALLSFFFIFYSCGDVEPAEAKSLLVIWSNDKINRIWHSRPKSQSGILLLFANVGICKTLKTFFFFSADGGGTDRLCFTSYCLGKQVDLVCIAKTICALN